MKQYITEQQWREITDQQHVAFLKVLGRQSDEHITGIGFMLPLPSIGEMIQFLDVCMDDGWWRVQRDGEKTEWGIVSKYGPNFEGWTFPELIDTLWNAVKMMLEEENGEE